MATSTKIFVHVLNFLRDPNYPYPQKYYSELDYYLIKYTYAHLYNNTPKQKCIRKDCLRIRNQNNLFCIDHELTCAYVKSIGEQYCIRQCINDQDDNTGEAYCPHHIRKLF